MPDEVWARIIPAEEYEERFASTISSAMYARLIETADNLEFLGKNVHNDCKSSFQIDE